MSDRRREARGRAAARERAHGERAWVGELVRVVEWMQARGQPRDAVERAVVQWLGAHEREPDELPVEVACALRGAPMPRADRKAERLRALDPIDGHLVRASFGPRAATSWTLGARLGSVGPRAPIAEPVLAAWRARAAAERCAIDASGRFAPTPRGFGPVAHVNDVTIGASVALGTSAMRAHTFIAARSVPGVYALQAHADGPITEASGPRAAEVLARLGAGRALPREVVARLAPALARQGVALDLAHVRVHDGAEADALCRELGAHAFALGRHVVFRAGRFRPDERDGVALLAHELTHVWQQARARVAGEGLVVRPALEREADQVGAAIAAAPTVHDGPAAPAPDTAGSAPGASAALQPQRAAAIPDQGARPRPEAPQIRAPTARTLDGLVGEARAHIQAERLRPSAVFIVADRLVAYDANMRVRGSWELIAPCPLGVGFWHDGGVDVRAWSHADEATLTELTGARADTLWVVGVQHARSEAAARRTLGAQATLDAAAPSAAAPSAAAPSAAGANDQIAIVNATHRSELRLVLEHRRTPERALRILSHWDSGTIETSWRSIATIIGQPNAVHELLERCEDVALCTRYARELIATCRALDPAARLTLVRRLGRGSDPGSSALAYLVIEALPAADRERLANEEGGALMNRIRMGRTPALADAIRATQGDADGERERRATEDRRRVEGRAEDRYRSGGDSGDRLAYLRPRAERPTPSQAMEALSALEDVRARAGDAAVRHLAHELGAAAVARLLLASERGTFGLVTAILVAHWSAEETATLVDALAAGSPSDTRLAWQVVRAATPEIQALLRRRDGGSLFARATRGLSRADVLAGDGLGLATNDAEAGAARASESAAQAASGVGTRTHLDDLRHALDAYQRAPGRDTAEALYTLLTSRTPDVRRALVRRLDALAQLDRVFATLGFQWVWAESRRATTRTILIEREPAMIIAQLSVLTRRGVGAEASLDPTSEDAFLADELLRALPTAERAAFRAEHPTWVAAIESNLDASGRRAVDRNSYRGGPGGDDRVALLARLGDPALWRGTGAAEAQLGNVCRMAIAAGHREEVWRRAREHDAFNVHRELMRALGLEDGASYRPTAVSATDRRREGSFQDWREFGDLVAGGVGSGALGLATGHADVRLDRAQQATGGHIAGAELRQVGDGSDTNRVSIDVGVVSNVGRITVDTSGLDIVRTRFDVGDSTFESGAIRTGRLHVEGTYPTAHTPSTPARFVITLASLELEHLVVTSEGALGAIDRVTIQGVRLVVSELPVPPAEMQQPERARAAVGSLLPRIAVGDVLTLGIAPLLRAYRSAGSDAQRAPGRAFQGPGGAEITIGQIILNGITSSRGDRIDAARIDDLAVAVDRTPSVHLQRLVTRLDDDVRAKEERLAELARATTRTPADAHEGDRLRLEVRRARERQAELRRQIEALRPDEQRYLRLYGAERRGEVIAAADLQFMRDFRARHAPAVLASARQITLRGAESASGISAETVEARRVQARGSTSLLSSDVMMNPAAASATREGVSGTTTGEGEVEVERLSVTRLAVRETITLEGLRRELADLRAQRQRAALPTEAATRARVIEELFALSVGEGWTVARAAEALRAPATASTVPLAVRSAIARRLRAYAAVTVGARSVDFRGLRLSGAGSRDADGAASASARADVGEIEANEVVAGHNHVRRLTATSVGGRLDSASFLARGGLRSAAGGVSVGSLQADDVDTADAHADLVLAEGVSAGADSAAGRASARLGHAHVQGARRRTRRAALERQIRDLAAVSPRTPFQDARLADLRAAQAALATAPSDASGTHDEALGDARLDNLAVEAEGLGDLTQLAGGLDRELSVDVALGDLALASFGLGAGTTDLRARALALQRVHVRVKLRATSTRDPATGQGDTSVVPSLLEELRVPSLAANDIVLRLATADGEPIEISLPSGHLLGLEVDDLPLDRGFDPMTLSGGLRLTSLAAGLRVRVGNYFSARASLRSRAIRLERLIKERTTIDLAGVTLARLGFTTTGPVPPDSIVARLRTVGGEIRRIGQLSAHADLNAQGHGPFRVALDAFDVRGVNWRSGHQKLWVESGLVGGIEARGTLDVQAAGAATSRLTLQRLTVARLDGREIRYGHDEATAVVIPDGYLRDLRLEGPDLLALRGRGRIGAMGASIKSLVQGELTIDAGRVDFHNVTARAAGLRGRAEVDLGTISGSLRGRMGESSAEGLLQNLNGRIVRHAPRDGLERFDATIGLDQLGVGALHVVGASRPAGTLDVRVASADLHGLRATLAVALDRRTNVGDVKVASIFAPRFEARELVLTAGDREARAASATIAGLHAEDLVLSLGGTARVVQRIGAAGFAGAGLGEVRAALGEDLRGSGDVTAGAFEIGTAEAGGYRFSLAQLMLNANATLGTAWRLRMLPVAASRVGAHGVVGTVSDAGAVDARAEEVEGTLSADPRRAAPGLRGRRASEATRDVYLHLDFLDTLGGRLTLTFPTSLGELHASGLLGHELDDAGLRAAARALARRYEMPEAATSWLADSLAARLNDAAHRFDGAVRGFVRSTLTNQLETVLSSRQETETPQTFAQYAGQLIGTGGTMMGLVVDALGGPGRLARGVGQEIVLGLRDRWLLATGRGDALANRAQRDQMTERRNAALSEIATLLGTIGIGAHLTAQGGLRVEAFDVPSGEADRAFDRASQRGGPLEPSIATTRPAARAPTRINSEVTLRCDVTGRLAGPVNADLRLTARATTVATDDVTVSAERLSVGTGGGGAAPGATFSASGVRVNRAAPRR